MDRAAHRDDETRLLGLELLRFIAAVGVLVWHYQHFLFVGHDSAVPWETAALPLRWLLGPFYRYGYQGVELFWCISGFIFTWKYGALLQRGALRFGRFAWLRFSRLYPLHLATLLIVAGLQYLYWLRYNQTFVYRFNDAWHFTLNLGFANWWGLQSGESFNGPSWSVSAEVLIYVAFFCVCRLAGASWRSEVGAVVAFSVAAPLAKAIFGVKLAFTGAGTFFYLGALTLRVYERAGRLNGRRRGWVALACAGAVAVGAGLVAVHRLAIAGASLFMFPALVLLAQLVVRPGSQRVRALLSGVGNLTYASYMLHFPLQLTAMLVFGWLGVSVRPLVPQAWFMLAYLTTVLGVAYVVFRRMERPAQNWLRARFRRRG